MAEGISVWPYSTKSMKKWAFEVRNPTSGTKVQRRGFDKSQDAMRAAKELRLELFQKRTTQNSRMKVAQLAGEYLASLEGSVKPHTHANYKYILDTYFLPSFRNLPIEEVSEPQLTQLLRKLSSEGLFPGSVNTVRIRIIGLFSYAVKRRLLHFNPAKETRSATAAADDRTAVRAPLSAAEARKLLETAKGTQLDTFISLCLGLGLRKGEALGLRKSDVDFEKGLIYIRRSRGQRRYLDGSGRLHCREEDGDTKTASSLRALPLSAIVLEALLRSGMFAESSEDSYLVTSTSGLPISLSVLNRRYKELFQLSNLRYVRIHDLRHSAAQLAMESKVPLEAVSQALGHSSIEITKRIYAPKVQVLNEIFSSSLSASLSNEHFAQGGEANGLESTRVGQ